MIIKLNKAELKRIVSEVLAETQDRFVSDDRLAYNEAEAAAFISLKKHQLRDERLKGRIHPGKSGRNWLYSKKMLLAYVEQNLEPDE